MGWWIRAGWEMDAPGALGVGDRRSKEWDRLSVGTQGAGETAITMGKVSAFPPHVTNLTVLRCPADLEVGRCLQGHRVSRKHHAHKNSINPVLKKTQQTKLLQNRYSINQFSDLGSAT